MQIMTANGWATLMPRHVIAPGHVPSLLQQMGIDMAYDPIAAMAAYANGQGRGTYFTYYPDGTAKQTKGAINPLKGMFAETADDGE